MKNFLLTAVIIYFFASCYSDKIEHFTQNPLAKTIIAKQWQLYSRDLIDTAGNSKIYISRTIADTCFEQIVFLNSGTVELKDSCKMTVSSKKTGFWTWDNAPDNKLLVNFPDNFPLNPPSYLFQLENDSLQLVSPPFFYNDSSNNRMYLTVATYILK